MSLCRAILIVVSLGSLAAGNAAAQWPGTQPAQPAPQDNSVWDSAPRQPAQQQGSVWDRTPQQQPAQPATSPWNQPAAAAPAPAASPWAQPQQPPPCVAEFTKLREATEKRGKAIRAASERKASAKEACGLLNAFTAAEAKMIKYAVDNQQTCGIPPQIIDQMKKGQAQSGTVRTNVCRAAAAPVRPAGPSLSDALTGPVPHADNIKTGRGTFDTLTGSPLGR